MSGETGVDVRVASSDAWGDVERLFGRAGASNGCWCQYWVLGPDYHRRDRCENRRDLATQVDSRRAGLIAYREGEPVGWARLTPRSELLWLTRRFPRYDFSDDDPWTLSCFFVARNARGSGVMTALVTFAVQWCGDRDLALEAYPIDPAAEPATLNRFPGVLPVFLHAGFTEVGRLAADRVVVRRGPRSSASTWCPG